MKESNIPIVLPDSLHPRFLPSNHLLLSQKRVVDGELKSKLSQVRLLKILLLILSLLELRNIRLHPLNLFEDVTNLQPVVSGEPASS